MSYFSARQIARHRANVSRALPDRCTIFAPPDSDNPTTDGEGNIDRSFPAAWTSVATGAKCRVDLSRFKGEEKSSAGVAVGTQFNDIEFEHDAPLKQSYRVLITASTYQAQLVGVVFDVSDVGLTSFGVSILAQVQRKDIDV